MELFREDGCLSDEGLHALTAGQLDELGRLEAAEHLAYCDKCTDRYTALLTADALTDPPRDVRRTVMSTIWVRLMQSTYGRAAVAGVAAVLALTMWRTGALTFVTDHGSDLQALLPTVQVTLPEKQPPKLLPEKLGRPVTSRPGENILYPRFLCAGKPAERGRKHKIIKQGDRYAEKRIFDLLLRVYPRRRPDVSGLHEAGPLPHPHGLPHRDGELTAQPGTAPAGGGVDVQLL